MQESLEQAACTPVGVNPSGFNLRARLPHGLALDDIHQAMTDFTDFLGFINQQMHSRGLARLETMLMPANFSSLVGEFMVSSISKHSPALTKNRYHNGYPDLIPKGAFPNNSMQYAQAGVEVKASRYPSGWQGHNAETGWLMVFQFDSNRPADEEKGVAPYPFRFIKIVTAPLVETDWTFSGRSETSRRTITASVNPSGFAKMSANWVYRA